MFEKYTEEALRVIFFSRYEASQFGSPSIEAEHLFLGLIRQTPCFAQAPFNAIALKKLVESRLEKGAKTSTSVDLPISAHAKLILQFTAEEAQKLGSERIGTEHLLLGFLREGGSFPAELLRGEGVHLEILRERLKSPPL